MVTLIDLDLKFSTTKSPYYIMKQWEWMF